MDFASSANARQLRTIYGAARTAELRDRRTEVGDTVHVGRPSAPSALRLGRSAKAMQIADVKNRMAARTDAPHRADGRMKNERTSIPPAWTVMCLTVSGNAMLVLQMFLQPFFIRYRISQ
jgi:hypothetical protein